MDRTKVRRGKVIRGVLAVVLASGLAHQAAAGAAGSPQPVALHRYVVRAGDTLWSIAERIAPEGADPRPMIDEIEARNDLSGPLVPGQVLRVP